MSFHKDPDYYTRGVGAVAAADRNRARQRRAAHRARALAQYDAEMTALAHGAGRGMYGGIVTGIGDTLNTLPTGGHVTPRPAPTPNPHAGNLNPNHATAPRPPRGAPRPPNAPFPRPRNPPMSYPSYPAPAPQVIVVSPTVYPSASQPAIMTAPTIDWEAPTLPDETMLDLPTAAATKVAGMSTTAKVGLGAAVLLGGYLLLTKKG